MSMIQTRPAATPWASPDGQPVRRASVGLDQQGEHIEALIEQVESLQDPAAQALLHETLQSLLAFYGEGLARMVLLVKNAKPDGERIFSQLLRDKTVRALLFIHGLHPVDLETRLAEALDKVRPYLQSHGGNVELLGLGNDVARLRLQGSCKSCPSSAVTLELAIRQAIEEACPDLAGLEVEGGEAGAESAPEPVSTTGRKPAWTTLPPLGEIGDGEIKLFEVTGVRLVVCKTKGILYAYRNTCPACGLPLSALKDGQLECRIGHRYDVQKAGVSTDAPETHLDPFPLLVEAGELKVSVR